MIYSELLAYCSQECGILDKKRDKDEYLVGANFLLQRRFCVFPKEDMGM